MKRISHGLLTAAIFTATSLTCLAQPTAPAASELLADGKGAKSLRVGNLRHVRYIELFFSTHDPKTGKLVAPCYNTTFSSARIPASKDTAPQALVEGLDLDKLKKEYGAVNVLLNGPKRWMIDWAEVDVGKQRDFGGLMAPWVAELNVEKAGGLGKIAPYKPWTIARKSSLGWNKGNTWIMKGFEEGLKPQHTYEEFLSKGASMFKKLPSGWKVRVKTLDKDLIETPANGVATIMSDEFFNVYDKTGPGMTNYKP